MESIDFVVIGNDGDEAILTNLNRRDLVTVMRDSCNTPCTKEEFLTDLPVGATVAGISSHISNPAPGEN
jgi:hypothetical protein